MGARWASVKPRIRAVIGGIEFDHVVGLQMDFEGNAFPRATLSLPVGRGYQGTTKSQVATVHKQIQNLRVNQPAKVYLKVTPEGASPGDAEDWPKEEFVVFDGYAIGAGYRRGTSGIEFTVHLLHWLTDLDYSSGVSGTSHPKNPGDLAYSANQASMSKGSTASLPSWVSDTLAKSFIDDSAVADDLWGTVLQPWLVAISEQDRINTSQIPPAQSTDGKDRNTRKNTAALNALNRIAPLGGEGAKQFYVPLALKVGTTDATVLADAIAYSLTKETFSSFYQTSLWGKLLGEWGPSYFLSIVPRVSDALVVPFTPGLREPFKTIKGSEYDFANLASTMPRVPRAVGIWGAIRNIAGIQFGTGETKGQTGLSGWYEPGTAAGNSQNPDGLVILKESPQWLSNEMLTQRFARTSTGTPNREVVGTSGTPGAGKVDSSQASVDSINHTFNPIIDKFAQQWFIIEMLKGRHGEISGKLRFDLAPFSTVKLEATRENFIPEDGLGEAMYGTIGRISHTINAEKQQAGTSFTLMHIRTETENKDDKTSIEGPPLYNNAFKGCSLIDGF